MAEVHATRRHDVAAAAATAIEVIDRGGGADGRATGARGLNGTALTRGQVLEVAGDADPRLALAGTRVLVPRPLKVCGALGLESSEVGLAATEARLLVEHFVVVAVGDGALAAAGATVLLDFHAGAQLEGGRGVGPDDDVHARVTHLLGLTFTARALQAKTCNKWEKKEKRKCNY